MHNVLTRIDDSHFRLDKEQALLSTNTPTDLAEEARSMAVSRRTTVEVAIGPEKVIVSPTSKIGQIRFEIAFAINRTWRPQTRHMKPLSSSLVKKMERSTTIKPGPSFSMPWERM